MRVIRLGCLLLVLAAGAGCHRESTTPAGTPPTTAQSSDLPPTARPELLAMLRDDLTAPRHAADGGGHAVLVSGEQPATAGRPGRWTFRFTTGPLGIAAGGMLFFQPPPFWDWSPPQSDREDFPGYTTVTTDAAGVTLDARAVANGLLGVTVGGRALVAGEALTIVYGAGSAGAVADRYAEHESPFWFGVDGDGDGVRALVADPPHVDVMAGPPARLVATWPSVARPGAEAPLVVAALDALGSAGVGGGMTLTLQGGEGLGAPADVVLDARGQARVPIAIPADATGIHRLRVAASDGLEAETNPLEVSARAPRILWADLHGHSNFSDGTGTPDDYYRYARDVAGLDVAALSDHDHWGLEFLDQHPERWSRIRDATRRFHDPGRFVTLLAFEWTSWIWGHRHVLYFDDDGPILSTMDPATDDPHALWKALDGRRAVTVPHHPAGGPIAIDWSIVPDPHFEPVVEVSSVHGSSEAEDSPSGIYHAVPGHYARDALDRGYRLGFIGSGDSHDGHPGLAQIAGGNGGLAALLTEDATRDGVLAALRARRTYATNGARIILRFSVDGTTMGGTLPAPAPGTTAPGTVRVIGTGDLERIDLIRRGVVAGSSTDVDGPEATWTVGLPDLAAGEYVYVRVVQRDGGLAWSSPIFVGPAGGSAPIAGGE